MLKKHVQILTGVDMQYRHKNIIAGCVMMREGTAGLITLETIAIATGLYSTSIVVCHVM